MVEYIHDSMNGELIAIIVQNPNDSGVKFYSSADLSQQLGFLNHPTGHVINPHVHNRIPREVHYTQEILIIMSGLLKVDFYNSKREWIQTRTVGAGSAVQLVNGGHGFEVIENVQMYEIKQGPYVGHQDKTFFSGKHAYDL